MTQDIIEMARQAGFTQPEGETWYEAFPQCIEAFYKLATAKEREACAKVAEEYGTWGGSGFYEWFKKLGAEIRARGEA